MFRITTVSREYGHLEGHGIVMFTDNRCLDISYASVSQWHIGRVEDELGTIFLIRLGRLWIDYKR